MYARIENNIVTQVISSLNPPEGCTEYPSNAAIFVGADVRFYDTEGQVKDVQQCINDGLLTLEADETAVWQSGYWNAVKDYRSTRFWNKNSKEEVTLQLGEQPDDTLTSSQPLDGPCQWDDVNNSWAEIPDHSHEQYWNKQTKQFVQFELGQVPDSTVTEKEPDRPELTWNESTDSWELPFEVIKEETLASINALRKQKLKTGVQFNDKHISCDADTLSNITAIKEGLGSTITTPVKFRTSDNTYITLNSSADVDSLKQKIEAFRIKAYQDSHTVKDQIEQAETETALNALVTGYQDAT